MKTRSDKTIPSIMIAYGSFFFLPLVFNFNLTIGSAIAALSGTLMIIIGLWSIETWEIKEDRLTKRNFFGIFTKTVTFENIVGYKKKVISIDHLKNPLNIIKIFSSNRRYFIFRQITFTTRKNDRIKFDERSMCADDFNELYHILKAIVSRQTI